jgi:hypothetical protein
VLRLARCQQVRTPSHHLALASVGAPEAPEVTKRRISHLAHIGETREKNSETAYVLSATPVPPGPTRVYSISRLKCSS